MYVKSKVILEASIKYEILRLQQGLRFVVSGLYSIGCRIDKLFIAVRDHLQFFYDDSVRSCHHRNVQQMRGFWI